MRIGDKVSKNQTIFRVKKKRDFVVISRITLEDIRLSWEARGLYAFLLAKPDNWETCINHLIKCSPAGRDKTRKLIKELMDFKYIVKIENRTQLGQFSRPQYLIHESPLDGYFNEAISPETGNPSTDKPFTDKPTPDNRPLLKIQVNQEDQNTKKTTTTNNGIEWPKNIKVAHQQSILALAKDVDSVVVQLLLDELTGQINNIKNPVGYFRSLLLSHQFKVFFPAKALQVQSYVK